MVGALTASVFALLSPLTACATSGAVTSGSATAAPARGPSTPSHVAQAGGQRADGSPRAADIALSLRSTGRLRLQVTTVDGGGTALSTSLRVSVGSTLTPRSGVTLRQGSLTVHRLTLPILRPGATYRYDLTVVANGVSRTYPARGRYSFTAPASPTQALTLLYWGDSRPDSTSPTAPEPQAFLRIIDSALARSPRPVLGLAGGDLVNAPSDTVAGLLDEKYAIFAQTENRLARRMPVMAAPGNHENPGATARDLAWRRWFTFPTAASSAGLHYSFNDGDVHVAVLDSSTGGGRIGYYGLGDPRNSSQANWLVADLTRNRARWTIVMFHHPLFDPKPTDPWAGAAQAERNALARLFAREGVDLVLQSHVHDYRRHEEPVSKGGTAYHLAYITEGGGGASLYPVTLAPLDRFDVKAFSAYGYLMLQSNGAGKLTAVAYSVDATTGSTTVGDRFTVAQVPRGATDQGPAK